MIVGVAGAVVIVRVSGVCSGKVNRVAVRRIEIGAPPRESAILHGLFRCQPASGDNVL